MFAKAKCLRVVRSSHEYSPMSLKLSLSDQTRSHKRVQKKYIKMTQEKSASVPSSSFLLSINDSSPIGWCLLSSTRPVANTDAVMVFSKNTMPFPPFFSMYILLSDGAARSFLSMRFSQATSSSSDGSIKQYQRV